MIYLILCILVSVAILTVFRSFSKFNIHRDNTIVISYLISFILSFLSREKTLSLLELPEQNWFYIALIIGITFFIGFQLFARSTQKIGMAVTSVSGNTSVVIPITIALIFYSEAVMLSKIAGILLVIMSFVLIFKKEKSEKTNLHFIYLPILVFVFNGINASLMAYSEKIAVANFKINFMMLIFLAAFIAGLIIVIFNKNRASITFKTILASFVLGTLNYASTMLIIKSLIYLDDSIFFPLYNTGYIILSALFGYLFFKEKLLRINWIGIGIAIIGIIILTSGF